VHYGPGLPIGERDRKRFVLMSVIDSNASSRELLNPTLASVFSCCLLLPLTCGTCIHARTACEEPTWAAGPYRMFTGALAVSIISGHPRN
jgi:hypothetical protein